MNRAIGGAGTPCFSSGSATESSHGGMNRGHFPSDDAAIKLLWLAIRDIEDKRARARAKEKCLPPGQRRAPARLVEGAVVQGWRQALGALAMAYPDRLNPYLA